MTRTNAIVTATAVYFALIVAFGMLGEASNDRTGNAAQIAAEAGTYGVHN